MFEPLIIFDAGPRNLGLARNLRGLMGKCRDEKLQNLVGLTTFSIVPIKYDPDSIAYRGTGGQD
jgi:hypothetical protein